VILIIVGSGIPEMKTIISGIEMPQYLSFRTLVAKIVGLICAQAAGNSILSQNIDSIIRIVFRKSGAFCTCRCLCVPSNFETAVFKDSTRGMIIFRMIVTDR
jgi:hypothetical protein